LEQALEHGRRWCLEDYGMRRHRTTQRLPREYFEAVERPVLLPAPTEPYDIPTWSRPKVARDQHAQVAKALYSLPRQYRGHYLDARADRHTVRFYQGRSLVKTHPRVGPGQRQSDASDFPPDKAAYALRDVDFLARKAAEHGESVGRFATKLLEGPLPWTRMRRVYALLGLARRYGGERLLVGSMWKPRLWAYSRKARFSLGASGSAWSTIALVLSGMITLNTPPKNSQAASQASMAVSVVSL
jgi:hypothetical protein